MISHFSLNFLIFAHAEHDSADHTLIEKILFQFWDMACDIGPYLLASFILAGIFHVFVSEKFITKFLGRKHWTSCVKAALLGIPMPLCSCSIIPIAISLREKGTTAGASASFMAASPQSGMESVFATYGFFGAAFTGIRLILAFVSSALIGIIIDLFVSEKHIPQSKATFFKIEKQACGCSTPHMHDHTHTHLPSIKNNGKSKIIHILRYAFITLPRDIAKPLLLGIILASIANALIPDYALGEHLKPGILSMFVVTLFAAPLHVCALTAVPLALALVEAGLSAGTVLAFLAIGPAINFASVLLLVKFLGWRATVIYVVAIILFAWIAGFILDATAFNLHAHSVLTEESHFSPVHIASAIALLGLLFYHIAPKQKKCCCK